MRRDYLMRKFVKSSKLGISLPGYTDNRPDPSYLLDSISAPKTAVDGCEEVPANDKAHIPLTKCFALSDFGWGSLSPALPGPQATGRAGFI